MANSLSIPSRHKELTICPCCGGQLSGPLSNGCECGARAVGEALPKPEHELPSYARSLILIASGALAVLVFVGQTFVALFQRPALSLGFWSWVAAGETAAWRLKWISIPVMFVTLIVGRRIYRSMLQAPEHFCGVRHARRGLFATAMVGLLIALLIGITVPARIRQRQMSIEAGYRAQYLTLDRAFFEYQLRYKTLPDQTTLKEDLAKLPDPDGSIAAALRDLDPAGYQPRADVAAVATQKTRGLPRVIIRKVSLNSATDDATPGGLSFTNYELRLPGDDKILGNDDDWIGRDGIFTRVSEVKGSAGHSTVGPIKP